MKKLKGTKWKKRGNEEKEEEDEGEEDAQRGR